MSGNYVHSDKWNEHCKKARGQNGRVRFIAHCNSLICHMQSSILGRGQYICSVYNIFFVNDAIDTSF
jgi:hypothetical protein